MKIQRKEVFELFDLAEDYVRTNVEKHAVINIRKDDATVNGRSGRLLFDNRSSQVFIECGTQAWTHRALSEELFGYADTKAFRPFLTLFHETGHVSQMVITYENTNLFAQILAANNIAASMSSEYCGLSRNGNVMITEAYYTQPFEVAAQYNGVDSFFYWLAKEKGFDYSNKVVCDLINEDVDNNRLFLPKDMYHGHYGDVVSILKDLDEAINRSAHEKCDYNFLHAYPLDYFQTFVMRNGYKDYAIKFAETESRFEQELVMSAVALTMMFDSEYILHQPVVENTILSNKELFLPYNTISVQRQINDAIVTDVHARDFGSVFDDVNNNVPDLEKE